MDPYAVTDRHGIVNRVFGAYYQIQPAQNEAGIWPPTVQARLRGRLRLKNKKKNRHLIMVGDRVRYQLDPDNPEVFSIEELIDRKNAVQRSNQHDTHSLGANLDQAILVVSLCQPPPRIGFIDRFLVSCHAGEVPAILLFTKQDLLDARHADEAKLMIQIYQNLGYECHPANLLDPDEPTIEFLNKIKHAGVTLLCGISGTGKSTLLNHWLGADVQKTGSISHATGKGRHTTTNSAMFTYAGNLDLTIDTPGVKEWGVQHLTGLQIKAGYPEIESVMDDCKFHDCTHAPGSLGCRVQQLFKTSEIYYDAHPDEEPKSGLIHPLRKASLDSMLASLIDSRKIRTGDYIRATGRVRTGKIKEI